MKTKRRWILSGLVLLLALSCISLSYGFTAASLNRARGDGVFASPQDGAITRAYRNYCGVEKVEANASVNAHDGSNPHIWYAVWTVYADHRAPCDPQNHGAPLAHDKDYESGGSFYLNVKDGWVYMPEGNLPEYIGFWMKVFDLAGSGVPSNLSRK